MISAAEIRALLPHRYPMLLVDRVVHAVPGEHLVAHKAVTVNEPWYADRGDDEDLGYPPSLLIESWGQAAAVLAGLGGGQWDSGTDKVFLFGSMSTVEFHGAVYPGDVLEHHVRVSLATGDTVIFEGSSEVRGERVLGVDRAVLALRPAGALAVPGAHR